MKKNFVYTLAVAAMTLGFAACSNDEPLAGVNGADGTVTFTAQLPAEIGSRAFGEGENAKKLTAYVYESGSKSLIESKTAEFPENSLTTTVTFQLVNGKTYDILFWADAYGENGADTPYSYDESAQTVTVDYAKMASNDDKGDAFFVAEKALKVTGAVNKTVTLTRPFAQVNFGTDDLAEASVKNAFGIIADNTFGTLESRLAFATAQPDVLNLFDGTVTTTVDAAATAFAAAAPTAETFPYGTGYGYLSMSYVLVGTDKDVVDLTFDVINGAETYNTLTINNVPVQRNYRTNIYGSLLTSTVDFNVEIVPGFETPDYNKGPWDGTTLTEVKPVTVDGVETYQATTASELAWILKNVSETANVTIDSDIDMGNQPTQGIAHQSRKSDGGFSGTIDGNNHTIKNFVANSTDDGWGVGLIEVAKGATIKNINVSGGKLTSGDFAAAIVGCSLGNTTISNCHVEGIEINGTQAAAGILARMYGDGDEVINCTNSATITGTQKVGGIVAITAGAPALTKITGCTNTGNISGGKDGVGGILGYANQTEIKNCTNEGEIGTGSEARAGGILGYTAQATVIEGCTNKGTVKALQAGGIHGIVGSHQEQTITNNINEGEVIGVNLAGGISAADGTGTTTACVNKAKVTATGENGFAAGIVAQKTGGKIADCDGGTTEITAFGAARICASVMTGPSNVLVFAFDDTYYNANDIPAIFALGPYTAWGVAEVEKGTLHGDCAGIGLGTARMTIKEGASWDIIEGDSVGTWGQNKTTNTWTKL